jgi:DNA-binding PucR family transcriptional regulator
MRDLTAEVQAWAEARSAQMLSENEIEHWVRIIDDAIRAEVPEVDADPTIRQDLDISTAGALNVFLSRMPDLFSQTLEATPEMRALGRSLAQRGTDVSVVLRVYRVGQRVFWRELMADIHSSDIDHELRGALLDFLWDNVSRILEHVVEAVVDSYVAESEQRLHGSIARRAETVAAVLRGEELDPELTTRLLGHPMLRTQTALVLWATDELDHPNPTGRLEELAADIATGLRLPPPMVVPAGARTVWAWLASSPDVDVEPVRSLPDLVGTTPFRVAIGEPARGLEGFRTSHAEAQQAHTVAEARETSTPVTRYRDIELVSLMSADEVAMRRLVLRELGALADPGSTTARLRETLLAYFESGSSARAAEVLTVHKNTVLYRLQQAEELLGRPLDQRSFELEAALRIAATYGDSVLVARA